MTLEDPRAGRTTVQRYYLAPSYASAAPGEAEALDLLMRVAAIGLGQQASTSGSSIEEKTAANAGGWYSDSGLDSGRLGFYAIAAESVSRRRARAAIDGVIEELRETGVTQDRARPCARLLSRRVRLHLRQPVAHGAPLWLAARHRHDASRTSRSGPSG